nr:DNA alkylation repair protein [Maliibacterium massiliense]
MQQLRAHLETLADETYRAFHQKLLGVPTAPVLGVRLPALRAIAKQIAQGDWEAYLRAARDDSLEETMLQGMVIGAVRAHIDQVLPYIASFVPKIDNWAVCDSFCASLHIAKKQPARMWAFLQPYLHADDAYALRFCVVMLLDYYVTDDYIDQVLRLLPGIAHPGYYVKMAVAWALSICYIKYPARTLACLKTADLDDETYNKALQKIIESRRVSDQDRRRIRAMKRKRPKTGRALPS